MLAIQCDGTLFSNTPFSSSSSIARPAWVCLIGHDFSLHLQKERMMYEDSLATDHEPLTHPQSRDSKMPSPNL